MGKNQDLLNENAFVAAPNEPHFWNPVPSEGYKLVEPGYIIKGAELEPLLPREIEIKDIEFKAVPLTGNVTSRDNKLLLPLGHYTHMRDPFKQERGEVLFSVFGKLNSEEDILKFASDHGSLGQEKGNINLVKDTIPLVPIKEWKDEVEKIQAVFEIYEAYKAGGNLSKYIKHFDSDKRSNRPGIVYPGFTEVILTIPYKEIELSRWIEKSEDFNQQNYRVLILRGIAKLVNEAIRGQVSFEYFVGKDIYEANSDDQVRPFVTPQNLKSAIWLSFAWEVFKDGPKNRLWERCYISGNYYYRWRRNRNGKLTTNLRQRKNGPYKGLFYHPSEDDKARKYKEYQKKKQEGLHL